MAKVWRGALIAVAGMTSVTALSASAQVLGPDAPACSGGQGPAILATITGLKDARGTIKLELYPANETDFLEDDKKLLAAGKVFRRITVAAPASNVARMCIRVPRPGRYALFFGHDRDGKRKFDFWSDGAGFPGNRKIGRSRPKLSDALIQVGPGVTQTVIRAQYLRGLGGFGF
ncbi:Uncharacterized conserved protein, DUF2141 family [Sphingomonas palmae]|uniref:Uncharacterized conserved protein, DUF2141 family n=1 Tax=Sphingomonas palmae TaxID=1855283 RepID=A0A1H7RUN5_9SPHN|nr:DUF2141 domain-containing protein [Sphingomonas palmae]SEL63748.1 Uncharacterized conserved protein, DUF2141 family [Sphingomonas palmae]